MTNEQIQALIEQGIAGAEVHVDGDGTHFVAQVISDAFKDLSLIKQHRIVYGALGDNMKSAIHALSIQTFTRDQWAKQQAFKVI